MSDLRFAQKYRIIRSQRMNREITEKFQLRFFNLSGSQRNPKQYGIFNTAVPEFKDSAESRITTGGNMHVSGVLTQAGVRKNGIMKAAV